MRASNWEIFLAVVQFEKNSLFRFCNFKMLQKLEKAFPEADKAIGIKQCYKHGR